VIIVAILCIIFSIIGFLVWDFEIEAIFMGVSVVFAIAALVGAMKYNIWLVGSNVIWLLVNYGVDVYSIIDDNKDTTTVDIGFYIPVMVVNGCIMAVFVYPHIGFILQVRSGIMSATNYPREEHSCCCTTRGPA
jgi:hypothetical protein